MQTELTLSVGGLPPMSARGCIQELKAAPQGEFRRTVNGDLIFLGSTNHKYCTTIRCWDHAAIATDGLQIGERVIVGCIQPLCQKVAPSEDCATLSRDVVPGSVLIADERNQQFTAFKVEPSDSSSAEATTRVTFTDAHGVLFVFFRPRLAMRVVSFALTVDEWKGKSGWVLELEEI
ncbi:MAG: hypothetical protein LBR89_03450 [Holosporales bacterium]|jgi:hypothetical protein|nr:hypothetical protein [Holosporales bacterium]